MFDPARATLRYRIDAGRCLGVAWLAMGSAAMVEVLVARSRPDAIVIDLQHGLWKRRELEARSGSWPPEIPVLVRTSENTPFAIGMALDAGAVGRDSCRWWRPPSRRARRSPPRRTRPTESGPAAA